jgi:DUF4097 and DUF4098 domain-containing protein YvlB
MNRGSFVFPLLLIAVGGLFLVNNLFPAIPVGDLLARFWPILLIGWGLLRAAELLFAYQQGRPLPVTGLTGGEWLLAFLIAFMGGGILSVQRFTRNFPVERINIRGLEVFGDPFDHPFEGTVALGTANRVVVDNLRGNARIVAGDGNEVRVSGRHTVRAYREEEARRTFEQAPLEVVNLGNQVTIRTNQEKVTGDARISSEVEVIVPRNVSVLCRGRHGDFDVSGISGSVEVESDNAGVRVQDIGGGLRTDLRRSDIVRAVNVKGPVELKGRGDDLELENIEGPVTILASFYGDLQFRNIPKPVRYESNNSNIVAAAVPGYLRMSRGTLTATRLQGPIRIESKTKDIRLSEFVGDLEVRVGRGDVDLRPGLKFGRIDVRSQTGDLDFAVPSEAKFEITARTSRGEVDNQYEGPLKTESEGRGGAVTGKIGSGPSVSLTTNRGELTVRKAAAGEDWPEPDPEPMRVPPPPRPGRVPAPPRVIHQ